MPMRRIRTTILLVLLFVIFPGLVTTGSAQAPGEQFFEQTGHLVSGPFLAYYQGLEDPLLLLGYPITDRYFDPFTGREVQYFQKGRLELVDTPAGQAVRQAPLGELLYDPGTAVQEVPADSPACRHFAETGRSVCYSFWTFYQQYNGREVLGLPISNAEIREGRYVQYFENARLEWRPELPAGHRVVLTDLGRIYFDKVVGNQDLTRPSRPDYIPAASVEIKASAFVTQALIASGNMQTVQVIVQDQFLRPVAGAETTLEILYPDGTREVLPLPATDERGIAEASFPVGSGPVRELVTLNAVVSYQGKESSAQTWFRLWW